MDETEEVDLQSLMQDRFGFEDPVNLGGKDSCYFVLMNGIECDQDEFTLCNLKFARLKPSQWRALEKRWVVDLYRDFYEKFPRFFCLMPYNHQDMNDEQLSDKLKAWDSSLQDLIDTLRILEPGILVDVGQTMVVLRSQQQNLRNAYFDRYRLYSFSIGYQETFLQPKQRKYCGKDVFIPPRIISSIGDAWDVTDQNKQTIETFYKIYQDYSGTNGHPTINFALRNFTVGQNIFLKNRQRLLSLLGAMESLVGNFTQRKQKPTLGKKIATLYSVYGFDNENIEENIEQELRRIRNAISHGSDFSRDVNLNTGISYSSEIIRLALKLLIPSYTSTFHDISRDQPDIAHILQNYVNDFQTTLSEAAMGEQVAEDKLRNMHAHTVQFNA